MQISLICITVTMATRISLATGGMQSVGSATTIQVHVVSFMWLILMLGASNCAIRLFWIWWLPYILVYKSAFFSKKIVEIIQSDLYSGETQIHVHKPDKLNMWSGLSAIRKRKYQSPRTFHRLTAYQMKENTFLDDNPVYFLHNLP